MAERIAFRMNLNPGQAAEYEKRHDEIFPELATALKRAGISDYSIWLDPETHHLFAILTRTDDHTMDRLPFVTSLGLCLLAARASGIAILDGVHLNLDDDSGLEYSCKQGAELGFDGKTLIHPKTIDAANKAFSPSPDEVEWSKKIIKVHAEATKEGKGVVVVDGSLIENLHVLNAERLVTMADAIAEMEADLN